jgi:hypothetical protein
MNARLFMSSLSACPLSVCSLTLQAEKGKTTLMGQVARSSNRPEAGLGAGVPVSAGRGQELATSYGEVSP